MELPFFSAKKEPGKSYVALKISLKNLTVALWQIADGKVSVGKMQTTDLSDIKDLLPAADKAISEVTAGLIPEPKEILFGLPADWVSEGKIIEPYTGDLKKLCQELDFSPLGFVTIPEAIINYLKEAESAPLTAILVGMESGKLFVTVIRAGNNLGTQVVETFENENPNESLEKALKQFHGAEILPSRILIYDGRIDLEKLREQILTFPWTQKLPFLHFPKVEILDTESVAKAVAIAGGTELGGKMADENAENVSAADLGFVKDQDVAVKIKLPQFTFPKIPKINFLVPLLTVCSLFLVSFIAFFVYINFFTAAKITLYVSPKILEKDQEVVVVTSGEMTGKEAKILGEIIEVDENGSKRTVTTGKRLVGTKAKGAVTFYTPTIGKTFPAGMILIGPNNLRFGLDNEVTIASGSAALWATSPGNITALGIGESYNLGSGSLLALADYSPSSYQAKNDSPFSGGTSRQAQVVVTGDQDRLLATLSAELTSKSIDDLRAKLSSGQNLLDKAVNSTIIKKQFDRSVDEEADSVGLNLTMHFVGVIVNQNKLIELFGRLSVENIPSGYDFNPAQASAEVVKTTINKNGEVSLATHFKTKLLPRMDNTAIIKTLSGKNFAAAKNYLTSISGVTDSAFYISPKIFGRFQIIPRNPKNISLDIVAQ
ncbi:MAG: hypothetical protein AAB506_01875 [Patescibacteria group bacterium]